MLSKNWQLIEITEFPGLVDIIDPDYNIGAIEAKNIVFLPGEVGSRKAFHRLVGDGSAPSTAEVMYNFLSPTKGSWILHDGDGVNLFMWYFSRPAFNFEQVEGVSYSSATRPLAVPYGERLFVGFYGPFSNAPGYTGDQAYILSHSPRFVGATVFSGSGLNDGTIGGTPSPVGNKHYFVQIDGTGTPDTFKWSEDNGRTFVATGVAITGAAQNLSDGTTVTFGATTGHTLNDSWSRHAKVWVADEIFQGPYTYVPGAPTEPGAGTVTAGVHRLGYIIQHRSGFLGRPSPHTSGAPVVELFAPVSFTSAGSKNLSWTLNPTVWPESAVRVYVIMSPVSDPNTFYFVPGAVAGVPGGSAASTVFTIDIDDAKLQSTGKVATDNLFMLTAASTATSTGTEYFGTPLIIFNIFSYSDRMGYIASGITVGIGADFIPNAIFVSARNKPEHISFDRHQINPHFHVSLGHELAGRLYLFGPDCTYMTYDNGLDPAEWPTPSLVDGDIGATWPRCVLTSSDGKFLWVAHTTGLYVFDGQSYTPLPMSYLQRETWNRINKQRLHFIQICEDPINKRVHVLVPLDNSSWVNHWFVWDYSLGISNARARCSNWTFNSGVPDSIILANNIFPVTVTGDGGVNISVPHGPQLVISASGIFASDKTSFYLPNNPYEEVVTKLHNSGGSYNAVAIDFAYETGRMSRRTVPLNLACALQATMTGNGTMTPVVYGRDRIRSFTMAAVTLAAAPGKDIYRRCHLISEDFSLRFARSAVGEYFSMSRFKFYESPYALFR